MHAIAQSFERSYDVDLVLWCVKGETGGNGDAKGDEGDSAGMHSLSFGLRLGHWGKPTISVNQATLPLAAGLLSAQCFMVSGGFAQLVSRNLESTVAL